jgi:hypothetical protein
MAADWQALPFLDEEITVHFRQPPVLEKKPEAPQAFDWHGTTRTVAEVISSWFDFDRKGREARNMAPAHLTTAPATRLRGWGRFYFRCAPMTAGVRPVLRPRPESAGDRKDTVPARARAGDHLHRRAARINLAPTSSLSAKSSRLTLPVSTTHSCSCMRIHLLRW